MAKDIPIVFPEPDDPMFKEGWIVFTPARFGRSKKNTAGSSPGSEQKEECSPPSSQE